MYSNRTPRIRNRIRHVDEASPHRRCCLTDVLTVYGPLFLQLHRVLYTERSVITRQENFSNKKIDLKIFLYKVFCIKIAQDFLQKNFFAQSFTSEKN